MSTHVRVGAAWLDCTDPIADWVGEGFPPPALGPPVMPIVSRGMPVSASHTDTAATRAVDSDATTLWRSYPGFPSTGSPERLASNLNAAIDDLTSAVVVLYNPTKPSLDAGAASTSLAVDYKIRKHTSASGTAPLIGDAGWVDLETVTANGWAERLHGPYDLSDAGWVDVRVTATNGSGDNADVSFDFEVRACPDGTEDTWHFVTDSIYYEGFGPLGGYGKVRNYIEQFSGRQMPVITTDSLSGHTTQATYTNRTTHTGLASQKCHNVMLCARSEQHAIGRAMDGTDSAAWKSSMQSMLDWVTGQGMRPWMVKQPPVLSQTYTRGNGIIINGLIDELVTANPGVLSVDMWTFFDAHQTLVRSDGLHLTYPGGGATDGATVDIGDGNGALTGYGHLQRLWGEWFRDVAYGTGPEVEPVVWDLAGFNWPGYYEPGTWTDADAVFAQMVATGAKTVALFAPWYQATWDATSISRSGTHSPTDADIVHMITAAHDAGLNVFLRPVAESADDTWRGQFNPGYGAGGAFSGESTWHTSYRAFITHLAQIAEDNGVEYFSIGSEMVNITNKFNYTPNSTCATRWRGHASAIRAIYSGLITYDANWGDELAQIDWWDAVDLMGVDAYYPLWSDPNNEPTQAQLVAAWAPIKATIDAVRGDFDDIPYLFSEVGYPSRTTAFIAPYSVAGGIFDSSVQEKGLEALWETFMPDPVFRGVALWAWYPTVGAGGTGDLTHTPQGKSTETLLRSLFASVTNGGPDGFRPATDLL